MVLASFVRYRVWANWLTAPPLGELLADGRGQRGHRQIVARGPRNEGDSGETPAFASWENRFSPRIFKFSLGF